IRIVEPAVLGESEPLGFFFPPGVVGTLPAATDDRRPATCRAKRCLLLLGPVQNYSRGREFLHTSPAAAGVARPAARSAGPSSKSTCAPAVRPQRPVGTQPASSNPSKEQVGPPPRPARHTPIPSPDPSKRASSSTGCWPLFFPAGATPARC